MLVLIEYKDLSKRYKQVPQHILQHTTLQQFILHLKEIVRDKDNNIERIRLVNKLVSFYIPIYTEIIYVLIFTIHGYRLQRYIESMTRDICNNIVIR